MNLQWMNALPWFIAFGVVLCLYLYVRSKRIRRR